MFLASLPSEDAMRAHLAANDATFSLLGHDFVPIAEAMRVRDARPTAGAIPGLYIAASGGNAAWGGVAFSYPYYSDQVQEATIGDNAQQVGMALAPLIATYKSFLQPQQILV